MHELSLAQDIAQLVLDHVPAGSAAGVREIRLTVNEHGNILVPSLEFCFEAIRGEYGLINSRLVIRMEPVQVTCVRCGAVSRVRIVYECTACGSQEVQAGQADDLRVTDILLDD